ncbi:hypothetical protein [Roseiflexus sp.]
MKNRWRDGFRTRYETFPRRRKNAMTPPANPDQRIVLTPWDH